MPRDKLIHALVELKFGLKMQRQLEVMLAAAKRGTTGDGVTHQLG